MFVSLAYINRIPSPEKLKELQSTLLKMSFFQKTLKDELVEIVEIVKKEQIADLKSYSFAEWCDENRRVAIVNYDFNSESALFTVSIKLMGERHTATGSDGSIELALEKATLECVRYLVKNRKMSKLTGEKILGAN